MHYYLSRFVGTGLADDDPFLPEVVSAASQWQAIDLRGDPTQQAGRCLVSLDVRPATDPASAVYLGTDLDRTLSATVRNRISQAFNLTLDASENTVRAVLTALLTKYADDDDTVRPNRLRGRRIVLGADAWTV